MVLPNFFIVGVVKGGTGALHQYLSHHPEIFMSSIKEPRYFNVDPASRPDADQRLAEYGRLFEKAADYPVRGESTSSYFYDRAAIRRIRATVANAKILVSLRNPVDRAFAHYCMNHRVREASDAELLRGRSESWAAASLYADHLAACVADFGPANVHVGIFEEWGKSPEEELRRVYRFLGVDESFVLPSGTHYRPAVPVWGRMARSPLTRLAKRIIPRQALRRINDVKFGLAGKPGTVSPAARQEMLSWYRRDIENVEQILGRSLEVWKVQAHL